MLDGLSDDNCMLLDKICKISIDICKVYEELYQLEILELRESIQFNTKLDYLKKLVLEENNLYNMIDNYKDLEKIFGFVVASYFKDISLGVKAMLRQYRNRDIYEIARIRIIKKLEFRLNILGSDSKDYDKVEKSLIFNEVKQKKFYSILESCVLDGTGIDRNILIYEKYFNALFLENDEKILLNNDFFVQDFENVELSFNDEFGKTVKEGIIDFVKNEIIKLLELTDEDYEDADTKMVMVITMIGLRSYLLLMDGDTVNEINYWFHEYIESFGYLYKHKFDKKYRKTEEYIINAFKKYNDDRGKYLSRKKKTDNGNIDR